MYLNFGQTTGKVSSGCSSEIEEIDYAYICFNHLRRTRLDRHAFSLCTRAYSASRILQDREYGLFDHDSQPIFFLHGQLHLSRIAFFPFGWRYNEQNWSDRKVGPFFKSFFRQIAGRFSSSKHCDQHYLRGNIRRRLADTAALGSVFIPNMVKEGYDKPFSTAVTIASSIISPIIPPSIIMVIYGAIMGVSIAGLFAAGIVPGLMVGIALMILTRFIASKKKYPRHPEKITIGSLIGRTKSAFWALIMPILILGGIIGGVVTPTEAAAVAVGYALFLGFVVYRNLALKDLYGLFLQNAITVSIIAVIIACATILGWLLSVEQVPQKVASLFMAVSSNKYVILLLINVFLIFVGMFMDIVSALLILGPILTPLAVNLGVHPLHFGIMMCVNLNIALMTPPLGGCLFVAMLISKLSLGEIVKALWPFIMVEFAVLFLIVYFPPITMFVPKALGLLG